MFKLSHSQTSQGELVARSTIETAISAMEAQSYEQWINQLLLLQAEYAYKSKVAWEKKKKIHEAKAKLLAHLFETFNNIRAYEKIPAGIDTLPLLINLVQRCWIYNISLSEVNSATEVDVAIKMKQDSLCDQSVFHSKLTALADGTFPKKLNDFAKGGIPSYT